MKYKKNGFTLIELLAVIIVLAIVTLLAVQAILPQVDKAKKNAFVVEVNNAIDAAQLWYSNIVLEGGADVSAVSNGVVYCVKISTLINEGYFDASSGKTYSGYIKLGIYNDKEPGYSIAMSDGKFITRTSSTSTSAVSAQHKGKITNESANSKTAPTVVECQVADGYCTGITFKTKNVSESCSNSFDYDSSVEDTTKPNCS